MLWLTAQPRVINIDFSAKSREPDFRLSEIKIMKKLSPKKPEINIEIINLPDSNNMKLELKNNREDVRFVELNEIIESHLNFS